MEASGLRFRVVAAKTIVAHTLTYVAMGALAAHFLDYAAENARPCSGMRPMSSAWVMAGPLFQPLRGLVFASVFYPLRGCLFARRHGWALTAWMLIAIGILSTFGPAPGSLEGLVYKPVAALSQMRGWLEVVPQALLLSAILCYWVDHPEKRWVSWTLGILFAVTLGLIVVGLLVTKR